MDTIYNVDLGVENCHSNCPRPIYEKTVDFLMSKGLLGIKRINKYGEINDGPNRDCNNFRKAFFDVHYNANLDSTLPELLDQMRISSSSEDDLSQKIIETGEDAIEILVQLDPTAGILPWNIYSSMPICSSLEIMTPAGKQSLHYHTADRQDCGVIQLWKPERENNFYVLDELKRTLGEVGLSEFDLYEKQRELRKGFHPIKLSKIQRRIRGSRRASSVYKKLLLNPDEVKKFPRFIKILC